METKKIKLIDRDFCENFGFTVGQIVETIPCPDKYRNGSFFYDLWVFSPKFSCPVRIPRNNIFEICT